MPPDSDKKKPFGTRLLNSFLQGLLLLLPIYLTFYIVYIIFRMVYRFLAVSRRLIPLFPDAWQHFRYIDLILTVIAFIVILLLITLIGALAKTLFGKGTMKLIERIIKKLPGINTLYKSLKQLINTVFPKNQGQSFTGVVYVRYPHRDSWSIAFLTSEVPEALRPDRRKDYIAVFMPSTPNPTTGFVMIVPRKDVIVIDIPIEEAFKIIMSGGLIMEDKPDE